MNGSRKNFICQVIFDENKEIVKDKIQMRSAPRLCSLDTYCCDNNENCQKYLNSSKSAKKRFWKIHQLKLE